ncbi:MAG: ribosome recycling factor [Prevotella sp.]|nr:ribosome recycling factor [Prevotella sp.]
MSNKELEAYFKTLEEGFTTSEKKLLQERAAHNASVINCDEEENIVSVPAKDIIAAHSQYQ